MAKYGTYQLTITSPIQTFAEPITATEMADFLRLPSSLSASDEALLDALIQAAREVAEAVQGRDLVAKQLDLWLDSFPLAFGSIPVRGPLATVDLVSYRDSAGTTTALTEGVDYIVDTARALVMPVYAGSWPSATLWPSSAVLIRHTTAPPAIDAVVLNGIRFLVSGWYEGRLPFSSDAAIEMPFGVTEAFRVGARTTVI